MTNGARRSARRMMPRRARQRKNHRRLGCSDLQTVGDLKSVGMIFKQLETKKCVNDLQVIGDPNVGGGLPPMAPCQSILILTGPLLSGASPLPHWTSQYKYRLTRR